MPAVKSYSGSNNYIFVSYAHKDSDQVVPIIAYLQRRGYNVWFDEGINPGRDWAETLGARIENCSCFLGFISMRSILSKECEKEIRQAIESKKSMVNVFLEPIDSSHGVAEELLRIQGIEKFKIEDDSSFYLKLLEHGLFEPCRDTEEYQIIEDSLVRYNGSASSVVIPDNVTKIGYNAFEGNNELQWVYIPAGVDRIGKFAFSDTPALHEFSVAEDNGFFSSPDGILFNKGVHYLLCYPSARQGESYNVPEGVTQIAMSAFSHANVLAHVSIPDSVFQIGDRAFEACRNLVEVEINAPLKKIRPYTFSRCASLVSCNLPDSLEKLGDGAFSGCTSMTEIKLPASLRKIGEMGFAHCESLKEISVGQNVRYISEYCFHECSSLVRADLSYAEAVRQYAFKNCESLETVVFSDNLALIGRAAFSGCASLESLSIPGSVETIDDYAFDRCPKLKNVVFGDGVKRIGKGAFEDDVELKHIVLPSSIEEVHPQAFPEWTTITYA